MEEMSRQLGENLPIALQAASRATGKTTPELIKLISSGQLMTKDFIVPFAKAMREIVRETGALDVAMKKVRAEQGRFVLAMQKGIDIGFIAGKGGFASAFKDLTYSTKVLTPAFKVVGKIGAAAFKALAFTIKLLAPILNVVVSAFDKLTDAIEHAADSTRKLKDLSVLEAILRGITIGVLYTASAFLYMAGVIQDVAEWIGVSEDGSNSFIKDLAAMTVGVFALAKAFKFLKYILSPIYKLFTGLFSIFSKLRGVAPQAAAAVTSTGGSIVSSGLVRGLGGIGAVLTALGEIGNPADWKITRILSGEEVFKINRPNGNNTSTSSNVTINQTINSNAADSAKVAEEVVNKIGNNMPNLMQGMFKSSLPAS